MSIQPKTYVLGLKGAVLQQESVRALEDLVTEATEIRFHAFGILSLCAADYAAATTDEQRAECGPNYSGEPFNQTSIDQALAFSRSGNVRNSGPLLTAAALRYAEAVDLDGLRTTRKHSVLMKTQVLEALRTGTKVAFSNMLKHGTRAHQRSALRQIHDLTSHESKVLCSLLSTSRESLAEDAMAAHVKRFTRIALRKRDELEKALHDGDAGADGLLTEYRALQRAVATRAAEARAQPELAMQSLLMEHAIKPRVRQAGFIGPLLPLDAILEAERGRLPQTLSQHDQLMYRADLLRRLARCGCDKLFDLVPQPSLRRVFVHVTKDVAAGLVPPTAGSKKRKKLEYDDLHDLMPLIFDRRVLKQITRNKPLQFGDSFRTDGIQLHVVLVGQANREAKRRKLAARAETNRLKKEAKAAGEVYVKPKKAKASKTAKKTEQTLRAVAADAEAGGPAKAKRERKAHDPEFVLPEGATLVGLDTGIRNVFGLARMDDLEKGFTYSGGQYYNDTGIRRRQKVHAKAVADEMETNDAFRTASDAFAAARTKTHDAADLLEALRVRGRSFRTLHAFYGAEKLARHKFLNYRGKQRTLQKMVKLVAPKDTDVVVVGDADFGSKVRGLPPGVAGCFIKVLQRELGPQRVTWGDEFRSSCLDSIDHNHMYHPPKETAVNPRTGATYVKKVYGLYQRSSPGVTRTWNRDVNAARNIVLNFSHRMKHGCLPMPFQRGTALVQPASCSYKWKKHTEKENKFQRWREPHIGPDSRLLW